VSEVLKGLPHHSILTLQAFLYCEQCLMLSMETLLLLEELALKKFQVVGCPGALLRTEGGTKFCFCQALCVLVFILDEMAGCLGHGWTPYRAMNATGALVIRVWRNISDKRSIAYRFMKEKVKAFAPQSVLYALMQAFMMPYPASSLRLVAVALARVLDSPGLLVVVATGLLDRSSCLAVVSIGVLASSSFVVSVRAGVFGSPRLLAVLSVGVVGWRLVAYSLLDIEKLNHRGCPRLYYTVNVQDVKPGAHFLRRATTDA
jgi:hypothetical protein